MAKQKTKKRNEIRIIDPSPATFKKVVDMARKERRTNGRQAEILIEAGLKLLYNIEMAQ